jgi:hypothetical protein
MILQRTYRADAPDTGPNWKPTYFEGQYTYFCVDKQAHSVTGVFRTATSVTEEERPLGDADFIPGLLFS